MDFVKCFFRTWIELKHFADDKFHHPAPLPAQETHPTFHFCVVLYKIEMV